ncbi:MAG: sodium/solute symporter [Phycisphaerales bacterium]
MLAPTTLALATLDWAVIGLYAALLLGTGVWLARKPEDASGYFLAGRRMPAWAVAISTLATSLSAATFVAAPDQAYRGDLTYLIASLGGVVAAIIVAWVFLPALYAQGATTVYEILGRRFGRGSQRTASSMFLLGRVCASGARVYIAAHALAFIVLGELTPGGIVLSVWIVASAGVLYTIFGGIATVIWTDVVQTAVFLLAVLVAVAHLALNLGVDASGALEILRDAEGGSKLEFLSLSTEPGETFTLWTALIGFALLNIGAYGTDQDLAQRLLTCKSKTHAARSLIGAIVGGVPVTALFMLFGLLLYVQDVTTTGAPNSEGVQSMMRYITGDAPVGIPAGIGGLMIAGLFASGLSSIDSALNAMSSAFVNDLYAPLARNLTDRKRLRVARLGVAVAGAVLGLFASACVALHNKDDQTLIEFALAVMIYAYAGLVGVFACALLTRRGSERSSIAAMLAGLASVLILAFDPAEILPEAIASAAFPWKLTIGVSVAFGICILGKNRTPDAPRS